MAGNKQSGRKLVATMIEKYGSYEAYRQSMRERAAKGGSVRGTKGGFAADKERSRVSGALGGRRSKRGHKYIKDTIDGSLYIDVITDEVVKYKYDGTVERRKRSPEIQNI